MDLAAERLAAGSDQTADQIKARFGGVSRELTINRAGLEVVLDLRVRFGLTPPMGPDLAVYVDESFAEQAAG